MSKRKCPDANADFKAIRMIDGKPMEFAYTNVEFANDFCQHIRFAFAVLGKDRDGLIDVVRGLATDPASGGDARLVYDLCEDWRTTECQLTTLAQIIRIAGTRTMLVMEAICGEIARRQGADQGDRGAHTEAHQGQGRTQRLPSEKRRMTAPREYGDRAESALTDLEGVIIALDIIRLEDALDQPGDVFHALAVLVKLAVEKVEALRQATEAEAKAPVRRVVYL